MCFSNFFFSLTATGATQGHNKKRKMLIINDVSYINENAIIDSSQYTKVKNNVDVIENQAKNYIEGYKKAFNKKRSHIDSRYRFSTLVNYHKELDIN